MENLVTLGTGNSRLMKSNISPSTTLAQLISMLNKGTFPYDIGPLNPAGISQQGTPLNKDTLLKDETAAMYGLGKSAVPDDILSILSKSVLLNNDSLESITGLPIAAIRQVSGTYTGTSGTSVTLNTGIPVKLAFVYGPGQSTENLAILTNGISQGSIFTGVSSAGSGTNYIGKFSAVFSSTTVRLSSLGNYRYYINNSGSSYSWTAFG